MKSLLWINAACLLCANAAYADLLPPQAAAARERFDRNPKAFDRYDVWCEGLGVGQQCTIQGNAFEGGGLGKCNREIQAYASKIDLLCSLSPVPVINRAIPEGSYQVRGYRCEQPKDSEYSKSFAIVMRDEGWTCGTPARVADKFCKELDEGQACTAVVQVEGKEDKFSGVCKQVVSERSVYYQGRMTVTRPVLSCAPYKPTVTPPLNDVGVLQKLLQ